MSAEQTCECCGQTLPPTGEIDAPLSGMQRQIVLTVQRAGQHGITTDRLFAAIWGNRPDGGPESGHKTLHVHVHQINKALRPRGWLLSGEHTGSRYNYGHYVLRRLDGDTNAPDR